MAPKPAWLFQQSAALPFFNREGLLHVVLVSSKKSKSWIFPKGVDERGMTPAQSAAKEAWEEAGVLGEVSDDEISRYEKSKWGGTCTIKVYPLRVTELLEVWDESEVRDRKVVPAVDAFGLIDPDLRSVLEAFLLNYASRI